MTTTTPRHGGTDRDELDERTREAWDAYRESLRDLSGADYEHIEAESWDRLQDELRALDEEFGAPLAPGPEVG